MAAKFTKLSPEQEALIPQVRDEWIRIGLFSEPAARKEAETGVAAAYRAAGLEPPRIIIWLDSPLAGVVGTAYLQRFLNAIPRTGDQVWDQVRGQVWDQVGGQVWDQVRGQVRDQVWDQVRGQVWDQVGGQVRDQVWGQVRNQVRGQVRDQVRDQVWGQVRNQVRGQVGGQVRNQVGGQVRDQVGGQVRDSLWGQHDAGFLGWYDFWRRIGLRNIEHADGLVAVARSAGWWWALRGAAVLTERPRYVNLDESGRLHSESGPAIIYPDGFGVWAWHGLRVARELIEEPVRIKQIQGERNTELRRMLTERYGLDRYIQDAGGSLVSQDGWGKLWRIDQSDDEPLVMVEMGNSTPEPDGSSHVYYERVPPTVKTPLEALAWQADVPPEVYAEMVIET